MNHQFSFSHLQWHDITSIIVTALLNMWKSTNDSCIRICAFLIPDLVVAVAVVVSFIQPSAILASQNATSVSPVHHLFPFLCYSTLVELLLFSILINFPAGEQLLATYRLLFTLNVQTISIISFLFISVSSLPILYILRFNSNITMVHYCFW
jgi:hypothetical protein